MLRRARPLALLVFLAAACRSEPRESVALSALDDDFEPLRTAFDADAAHVRVLAILSPT